LDGQRGFVPAGSIKTPENLTKTELKDGAPRMQLTSALTRLKSTLHTFPDSNSKKILDLPLGASVEVLNFAIPKNSEENWVRVKFKNKEGFLDLRNAVTALDLIASVALQNGEAKAILYTLSGWLYTSSGERIGPAEIQSADWRSQAFAAEEVTLRSSTKPSSQIVATLTPGTRLKLIRPVQQVWGQSFVPRLGLMAWTDEFLDNPRSLDELTLTTEQLFSRSLFDMATHPTRSDLRVASAKGIFITEDGLIWRQLKSFDDQNQAVSFTPSGMLIVGDKISVDAGDTFQPLVKWDTVTPLIKSKTGKVPSWLRITGLQSRNESISVEVEAGRDLVRLQTNDLGQTWILAH
jgi:hypothetical protein